MNEKKTFKEWLEENKKKVIFGGVVIGTAAVMIHAARSKSKKETLALTAHEEDGIKILNTLENCLIEARARDDGEMLLLDTRRSHPSFDVLTTLGSVKENLIAAEADGQAESVSGDYGSLKKAVKKVVLENIDNYDTIIAFEKRQ